MRVLTDPVDTGAVVLSLPQDVQSHAFDFPAEFFAERDWVIRRPDRRPGRGRRRSPGCSPRAQQADHHRRWRRRLLRRHRRAGGPRGLGRHPRAGDHGRQGRGAAAGLVADRRDRPGGHPGQQRPGPPGRLRAHRRLAADRLPDRVAVAVREPGRAVRVDQRQRLRRPAPRRHRHRRRRQARPRGARRRGRGRRVHQPRRSGRTRSARRWRAGSRCVPRRSTRTPRSTARRSPPTSRDIVPDTGALLTQGQVIGLHAGARPGRRHDRRRRRRAARGHAEGVGRDRGPVRPPGVRVLLHGLRDPGRDGRPARRPEPGLAGGRVHRRRHLPACRPPSWSPPRRRASPSPW